jgi:hypothetical protein
MALMNSDELGYLSISFSKDLSEQSFRTRTTSFILLSERNNVDFKNAETFEFTAVGGLGLNVTKSIQARYGLGLTEASQNADEKTPLFKYHGDYVLKLKQFEKTVLLLERFYFTKHIYENLHNQQTKLKLIRKRPEIWNPS